MTECICVECEDPSLGLVHSRSSSLVVRNHNIPHSGSPVQDICAAKQLMLFELIEPELSPKAQPVLCPLQSLKHQPDPMAIQACDKEPLMWQHMACKTSSAFVWESGRDGIALAWTLRVIRVKQIIGGWAMSFPGEPPFICLPNVPINNIAQRWYTCLLGATHMNIIIHTSKPSNCHLWACVQSSTTWGTMATVSEWEFVTKSYTYSRPQHC
ncbi:hypothetical protein F5148DRAFT_1151469 [Russula earlei]|uniref:Uncharacterized protein n=1 Tax=Russula earlei TaxID=71964 RepID=A0ACC0U0M6_9AGAM|nr:hypothetical protein F5148DRAFT_1151469 [Russula earlei]